MSLTFSPANLVVKPSTLPGSGKGLFTKVFIPRGTRIIEYTGKVTTWEQADHQDGDNSYIYYLNKNHVIDGYPDKKAKARYINDARGLVRVKGITNNCEYVEEGRRVYVEAIKNIAAGSELLVAYSKDYWDTVKKNAKDSE